MSESTLLAALNALAAQIAALAAEAGLSNEFVAGWKNNPTLGGNLNVDDKEIVSAPDGNIVLRPDNVAIVHRLQAASAVRHVIGSAYTITEADNGVAIYADSTSAIAITWLADLPVDFHCVVMQPSTGLWTVTAQGAELINGAASIESQGRYKMTYFIKTGPTTIEAYQ